MFVAYFFPLPPPSFRPTIHLWTRPTAGPLSLSALFTHSCVRSIVTAVGLTCVDELGQRLVLLVLIVFTALYLNRGVLVFARSASPATRFKETR